MNPKTPDTRPCEHRFFDRDNKLVGTVTMPPRRMEEPPRIIVYDGKRYIEGDGSGFYGAYEFAEVVE